MAECPVAETGGRCCEFGFVQDQPHRATTLMATGHDIAELTDFEVL